MLDPAAHSVIKVKSEDLCVPKCPGIGREDALVAVFHPVIPEDIPALVIAGAILTTGVKLPAVGALSRHIVNPVSLEYIVVGTTGNVIVIISTNKAVTFAAFAFATNG